MFKVTSTCTCILVLILATATARPRIRQHHQHDQAENILRSSYHAKNVLRSSDHAQNIRRSSDHSQNIRRSSGQVVIKRTDDQVCVRVSRLLGPVLVDNKTLSLMFPMSIPISSTVYRSFLEHVTGYDLLDDEERESVMCSFTGVSTYSEYLSVLKDLDISFHEIRTAYDVMAIGFPISRQRAERMVELSDWLEQDAVELIRRKVDFFTAIEESGFLGLDPEGTQLLGDVFNSNNERPPPLPVLDAPTPAKCSQLANAAQMLWEAYIDYVSNYEDNPEAMISGVIRQWTGIDITNHGQMRRDICQILDAGLEEGVRGLYNWVDDRAILNHLMKSGYPLMVEKIQSLRQHYSYMIDQDNSGQGSAPADLISSLSIVVDYINALDEMGMLSLRDDL